jgi:prevent-host-death family protein
LTLAPNSSPIFSVKSTYSITAAQARFPAVVRAAQSGRLVGVTKHNETVAFVISRERMEGIAETMELLADPKFMRALRDAKSGKAKSHPASSLAD